MLKYYVRKRKLVVGAMSALLAGSAFQATGCTVNLDEAFIQSLVQQVLDSGTTFSGHFRVGPPGGGHHEQPPPSGGEQPTGGEAEGGGGGAGK